MEPMKTAAAQKLDIFPLLISVAEAARLLSVSRGQVYKWVESGVLPRIPEAVSTRVLIPRLSDIHFDATASKAA